MTYDIVLVSPVEQSLDAISNASFAEVDNAIRTLAAFPDRGVAYDPIYEAAPSHIGEPLRVLYVRNYGIYYTVDHASHRVYVRFIEDQRMDPKMRFTGRLR